MKTKLLVLAALLAMSGTAFAAKVNWQGAVMVTAVTPGCSDSAAIGDNFIGQYFPSGLEDNGGISFLTLLTGRAVLSHRTTGRPAANKNYTAIGTTGRGEQFAGPGKFVTFATTPATITENTQTLVINSRIGGFNDDANCTATIQGAFVLRRD